MLMHVFSCYDKVTCVYGMPLIEVNDQSLFRNCKNMVLNELMKGNSSLDGFVSRRSDLVVYHIGTFDTEKGCIISDVQRQCFTAADVVDSVLADVKSKDNVISKFKDEFSKVIVEKMKKGESLDNEIGSKEL